MSPDRRETLKYRLQRLDADTAGTLFPLPSALPGRAFSEEHVRAFTRVCGNLGEALAIAREALA